MNMKEMKTENGTEKKRGIVGFDAQKKMLSQGLIELMQHKQVKDITVRELAERVTTSIAELFISIIGIYSICSNVWRKTFRTAQRSHLAHKGEPVLAHIRPMLTDVFHIVAENKEICRVLLSDNGDIKFCSGSADVIQEKLRTEWLNGYGIMKRNSNTAMFGALGFVGLLRTWFHRDCGNPPRYGSFSRLP